MAETMIERVAKALSLEDGMHPDAVSNDEDSTPVWHLYRASARAAIKAMRDEDQVTDEMLEAGRVALHAPENRHGAVLGAVFCAMIDAALSEGGE